MLCCAIFCQYYTTHEYYGDMLSFVCLFFIFYSILIARRQLVSILTLGETLSSGEVSQQLYSTCIRNSLHSRHPPSVESELGEISILGELPLLMKLSVTCASNTTLLTDTVLQPQCARGRAVLCFPVSSAYVRTFVQSTHGQLCNAAPHGCPDANRLLQIS